MVEGTGLENQRGKPPQVRILSFPPKIVPEIACYRGAIFKERIRIFILSFPPKYFLKKSRRKAIFCAIMELA